jgi:hypothetical protein
VRAYRAIIDRFIQEFGDGPVGQVTPEQILTYLNRLTEGNKPSVCGNERNFDVFSYLEMHWG